MSEHFVSLSEKQEQSQKADASTKSVAIRDPEQDRVDALLKDPEGLGGKKKGGGRVRRKKKKG